MNSNKRASPSSSPKMQVEGQPQNSDKTDTYHQTVGSPMAPQNLSQKDKPTIGVKAKSTLFSNSQPHATDLSQQSSQEEKSSVERYQDPQSPKNLSTNSKIVRVSANSSHSTPSTKAQTRSTSPGAGNKVSIHLASNNNIVTIQRPYVISQAESHPNTSSSNQTTENHSHPSPPSGPVAVTISSTGNRTSSPVSTGQITYSFVPGGSPNQHYIMTASESLPGSTVMVLSSGGEITEVEPWHQSLQGRGHSCQEGKRLVEFM